MSFNKRFLPKKDVLEIKLKELGVDQFLKIYYYNPDAIIGDKESFKFIESILNKTNKDIKK